MSVLRDTVYRDIKHRIQRLFIDEGLPIKSYFIDFFNDEIMKHCINNSTSTQEELARNAMEFVYGEPRATMIRTALEYRNEW